jgi:hypothetical protein
MRHFYQYRVGQETANEESDILSGLSDSLKAQVTLYVYKELLDMVPFFQNKAPRFSKCPVCVHASRQTSLRSLTRLTPPTAAATTTVMPAQAPGGGGLHAHCLHPTHMQAASLHVPPVVSCSHVHRAPPAPQVCVRGGWARQIPLYLTHASRYAHACGSGPSWFLGEPDAVATRVCCMPAVQADVVVYQGEGGVDMYFVMDGV